MASWRIPTLLACALLAALPVQADTITIRADEWLPYNGPSTRRPAGYMIEMAEQIAKAAGHQIDYRHLPWDDAIEAVRKGSFDCLVGAAVEEVPGFALPKAAWGVSQSAAYTLAEQHSGLDSIDQLKALRIAVFPDFTYGDELGPWIEQNLGSSDRLIEIDSGSQLTLAALSHLVARKLDVVIEDRNVMLNALQQTGLSDRVIERMTVGGLDPIYIACTPASARGAQFAQLFDDGTRSLRESGALDSILKRYGLSDWLQLETEAAR